MMLHAMEIGEVYWVQWSVEIQTRAREDHTNIFSSWSKEIAKYLLTLIPDMTANHAAALSIGGLGDIDLNDPMFIDRIQELERNGLFLSEAAQIRRNYETGAIGNSCN